jgi:hypothetical protein
VKREKTRHDDPGEEMKAFFVVTLSLATVLSSVPAKALDSRGFDSRGNCRLSQGCEANGIDGDGFHEPRNYRDFNGRNGRDDRNGRDRNDRRYPNQTRTDNPGAAVNRLATIATIGGIINIETVVPALGDDHLG